LAPHQLLSQSKFISVPDSDIREAQLTPARTPPIIGIQRGITWNVEEYDKLQKYMEDIRLYQWHGDHDSAFLLTACLNIYIRRQYNDHRPSLLHRTRVEANDAEIGTNKITATGIIGIVNILANQSIRYYFYMSMGLGTTPEAIGQKRLTAEMARLSVLRDGSMAGRGNVWNHVGNFGYGIPTNRYYEFGIHDSPLEPSKMLSRSVLATGLQQTQSETFLTASHSAIFTPK
jgi:hypothetical protein